MFSYEDRLRAVQLYIKHWYQEYEQGLGLATGYTRAPRYS
jgi:hypothetical protein